MTEEQLATKLNNMPIKAAMPEGGMAIMMNRNIVQYVQNHKITKIKNGIPIKNKRLMGISLSINHHNTLLLNTYTPAKGKRKNDEWISKQLIPIVNQCQEAMWLNIIGGDLNTTAYQSDVHPTPTTFKPSKSLLALTSPTHGLVDSFKHIHPKKHKYSFLKSNTIKCDKACADIEKLPALCLQHITSMLSRTDLTSLMAASKHIHHMCCPRPV